ncbi:MAG: DUF302 domain-containing protein [Anaerolineaceae bacterium]
MTATVLTNQGYSIRRETDFSFEDAVARVRVALQAQGFGVLTEIDVAATMAAKLDLKMAPFLILGVCNPALAHRALAAEPEVGVLLPCNVVVRSEGEKTVVEAMDPEAALGLVKNDAVRVVAIEAKQRLSKALESL